MGFDLQSRILEKDMQDIYESLSLEEKKFFNKSKILITGAGGFVGFYILNFFNNFKKELKISNIIGIDNFKVGKPKWLEYNILKAIDFYCIDLILEDVKKVDPHKSCDIVIHLASIASPVYYRKFPLETIDVNVWGLRKLLEYYKDANLKKFLFFSSSEIYGDPPDSEIPTNESYRGNVSTIGPRACYDEAKRFGETLCYVFNKQFNIPIVIVRPFNNYGPGMKLNDKRLPADFANCITANRDIIILSDGSPTRTYCYISDAIVGYLKALCFPKNFECFNIGKSDEERSVLDVAYIYQRIGKQIWNYTKDIVFKIPDDPEYLEHCPNRRCPDTKKARSLLNFEAKTSLEEGVKKFLIFLKETGRTLWL